MRDAVRQTFGMKGKVVEYTGNIDLSGASEGSLKGTVIFSGTFKMSGAATMNIRNFPESKFRTMVWMDGASRILIKEDTDPFDCGLDRKGSAEVVDV